MRCEAMLVAIDDEQVSNGVQVAHHIVRRLECGISIGEGKVPRGETRRGPMAARYLDVRIVAMPSHEPEELVCHSDVPGMEWAMAPRRIDLDRHDDERFALEKAFEAQLPPGAIYVHLETVDWGASEGDM